ncbi:S24 family peptidase [Sphingomonas naphthae]|uniref:S24 family peptidase n=2 Tax=Sphingomonas naphthae TaxID=1813468 RepID=A0ABY7TJH3_9SPHN|nr:S24 family peptidase [Sphingomonas naphthae]WCT72039.1 S24 family peptidase [Sphingomonas naphthae]
MMTQERTALQALIDAHREDYTSVSRLLGRNDAYIQQFIRRGTPRRLAEADRRKLARYFNVDESVLGGPAPLPPADLVRVPRLAVGASAGAGREVSGEHVTGTIAFPRPMLREMAAAGPDHLSIIRVEGESMEPLLHDGDEILVDRGDRADRLRDGIYVLRLEDRLMVKRIAIGPVHGRIAVVSDNDRYPSWPDIAVSSIDVIGRVVWVGRRLG